MKTSRTSLHRKPKPWRFRTGRRRAIADAARAIETPAQKMRRLEAREGRRIAGDFYRGRPAIKSLRDQWEAAAIRQFEADRRAYIRQLEREEAAKAKAQKRKRET